MQLSGGSTPRASMAPRASRRTAAAAGVAVETIPPPSPHFSMGSVTALTRTARPSADASTTCTDTVEADGGSASAPLRFTSSLGAAVRSRSVARSSGERPNRKEASRQPKLEPNVRISE